MRLSALIAAVAFTLLACIPSRTIAQSTWEAKRTQSAALKWEMGYLALSAIDAAETIDCMHRGICRDANPLIGKHSSAEKIILTKLGLGVIHFAAFKALNDRNPKTALRAAQISCAVQGGVVLINARLAFK